MKRSQAISIVYRVSGFLRRDGPAVSPDPAPRLRAHGGEFAAEAKLGYASRPRNTAKSSLGIEAQSDAISRFAQAKHLDVVADLIEVETGEGSDAFGAPTTIASLIDSLATSHSSPA
jgi:hypothetical protein